MANLLVWLVVIGLAFLGFGVLAGSSLGMQKRPRFWVRVLLGYLATLFFVLLVAGAIVLEVLPQRVLMLIWLVLVMSSLAYGPILCYQSESASPGSSDADGGGGSGPAQPSSSPTAPSGGAPLPDADQATARARDHNRPRLRDVKPRRRPREPQRTPTPTNG
jgi:hypothetical protein